MERYHECQVGRDLEEVGMAYLKVLLQKLLAEIQKY
jgi:hypothetical protein